MSKRDRKNGVPETVTSIPLVDPHALSDNPSIGELVRDATTQVSTLVRAEVELAKAEITRDVKKGLTGSVFFIVAGLVGLYSTFFLFFFLAELLDTWLWRWAAFLIVFLLMVLASALFAFLGYRKVRRIRGPQQAIESVKETTAALTPGLQKFAGVGQPTPAVPAAPTAPAVAPRPRPAVASKPRPTVASTPRPTAPVAPAPVAPAGVAPEPVTPEPVAETNVQPPVQSEEPTVQYDTVTYAQETVYDAPEAYSAETVTYEPAAYSEDEVGYAEETVVYADAVYSEEPTGPIPPVIYSDATVIYSVATDDSTAAVYADTGLPVTPEPEHEHRPGDPSGW